MAGFEQVKQNMVTDSPIRSLLRGQVRANQIRTGGPKVIHAVTGCTTEGAPSATATPLVDSARRLPRPQPISPTARLLAGLLLVAVGWVSRLAVLPAAAQAADAPAPATWSWGSQASAYLPAPTTDASASSNPDPAWRWTLQLSEQGSRRRQALSLSQWSSGPDHPGRTALGWEYRERQPLLIFGFLQYGGHLTVQATPGAQSPGPALDASVDAGAVVGNLAASVRLLHRSPQYLDLPATSTVDLFPLLPSPTPIVGTLAETEFRTSLAQTTVIANIGWRWPVGESPQVGMALGSQLRLGSAASLTARVGLKSDQGRAVGVYGTSINLVPWSGAKAYLDVATDRQSGCRWQGGLALNAEWQRLRGQLSLAVQQDRAAAAPVWGVQLTTQVGISVLGLEYSPTAGTGISASFSF